MNRPVCITCNGINMDATGSSVVQYNALASPRKDGAYQQYHADFFKCPRCGTEVAAQFGTRPSWEHFQGEGQRDTAPRIIVQEVPRVPRI